MVISSRTPEGEPTRCPVCGSKAAIVPSSFPTTDAPCPSCGFLLWISGPPFKTVMTQRERAELYDRVIAEWGRRREALEAELSQKRAAESTAALCVIEISSA